jgi:hypothetical protein
LIIDFQSQEGKDFIIHGNFNLGWETNFQASSPVFPLNDNGQRFPAQRQSAAVITGEVASAYRMSTRLSFGGFARFQQSPQYNELLVGLIFKLSFSPRRALFSSDLKSAASLVGAPERRGFGWRGIGKGCLNRVAGPARHSMASF